MFKSNSSRSAQLKAESWLLKLRNNEQHWGNQSLSALLALSLSSSGSWSASSIEGQLAIKQVDINFLYDRVRQGDAEIYSDRLIPVTVTLMSLCRHPTNYSDYALLGIQIPINANSPLKHNLMNAIYSLRWNVRSAQVHKRFYIRVRNAGCLWRRR